MSSPVILAMNVFTFCVMSLTLTGLGALSGNAGLSEHKKLGHFKKKTETRWSPSIFVFYLVDSLQCSISLMIDKTDSKISMLSDLLNPFPLAISSTMSALVIDIPFSAL